MMSMLCFKVKFALLFMTAFLITIHCSQAPEYDDDSDDAGNFDDFDKSELNFGDLENEDAQSIDFRTSRFADNRRRAFIVDGRRRSRRRVWRW